MPMYTKEGTKFDWENFVWSKNIKQNMNNIKIIIIDEVQRKNTYIKTNYGV